MPGRARGRGGRRVGRRRNMWRPRRRNMRRRPGRAGQGGLYVIRKTAAINIGNTPGVAGQWAPVDPTGNCLALGSPVVINNVSQTYDTPFSMKFNLAQLMNSTDITNISDRYKIVKAVVRIHCNFNQTGTAPTAGTPWLEWYTDHDDATVPSIANVRERMGVHTVYFNGSKPATTLLCRPRFADTIFQSGIASAYGLGSRREYINCSYPAVEHYGLKGILHNVQLAGLGTGGSLFDFDVTLHVKAKDLQ